MLNKELKQTTEPKAQHKYKKKKPKPPKNQESISHLEEVAMQRKWQLPLSFSFPCRIAPHCRTNVLLHLKKCHRHSFCSRRQQVGRVHTNAHTVIKLQRWRDRDCSASLTPLQCSTGRCTGWQVIGIRGKPEDSSTLRPWQTEQY